MGCLSTQPQINSLKHNPLKIEPEEPQLESPQHYEPVDQIHIEHPPEDLMPQHIEQGRQVINSRQLDTKGDKVQDGRLDVEKRQKEQQYVQRDQKGQRIGMKKEAESYVLGGQLQSQDVIVNTKINTVVEANPRSSVLNMELVDYQPNYMTQELVVESRQKPYLDEEWLVSSEGVTSFAPSVRNINFHIQIS